MNFRKPLAILALATGGLLAAGAAQARDVYWSIGINAPVAGVGVGTVISNAPAYPVAVMPAYPMYAPAPVVMVPPPVIAYRPAPRYVAVPVYPHRHGHGRWARERWERDRDGRWDDRRGHRHGDRW